MVIIGMTGVIYHNNTVLALIQTTFNFIKIFILFLRKKNCFKILIFFFNFERIKQASRLFIET